MRTLTTVAAFSALCVMNARITAQDAPTTASPRSTGTCIAILLPTVQGVEGSATEVAEGVRELFTSYLTGPAIQVIALETRLASQAMAEAQQNACTHVLIATLARKRSGGGGLLGKIASQAGSTMAWQIPGAGVGAAVTRGVAAAGAQAASELASGTRARDEMRLEFKLVSTDGRVVLKPKEEKVKASVDGEDLLTPLVHTASESIAAAVVKN